jgi:CheY-like chemotaxis protein
MRRKEPPDLILMDVSLPKIDGLDATEQIRKLANTEHTPIICVTAHPDDVHKRAIEVGCKEVVAKPIDVEKLPAIVAHYLKDE